MPRIGRHDTSSPPRPRRARRARPADPGRPPARAGRRRADRPRTCLVGRLLRLHHQRRPRARHRAAARRPTRDLPRHRHPALALPCRAAGPRDRPSGRLPALHPPRRRPPRRRARRRAVVDRRQRPRAQLAALGHGQPARRGAPGESRRARTDRARLPGAPARRRTPCPTALRLLPRPAHARHGRSLRHRLRARPALGPRRLGPRRRRPGAPARRDLPRRLHLPSAPQAVVRPSRRCPGGAPVPARSP